MIHSKNREARNTLSKTAIFNIVFHCRSLVCSNISGRWTDTKNLRAIPFHLVSKKRADDMPMKVFVTDPSKATYMMRGLKIVIWAALSKTEKEKASISLILPTETILSKVTRATNGEMSIGPPANSECCYILTRMTKRELFETFEDKIRLFELTANLLAIIVGGGLVIGWGIVWYLTYYCRRKEEVNTRNDNVDNDAIADSDKILSVK